jgi:hypothetical protein
MYLVDSLYLTGTCVCMLHTSETHHDESLMYAHLET